MANGLIDFGIIKPELANAFATGYQQAEDRRVAAMQEAQKNQLANLQLEAAMQESADRNALRNASSADVLANPMRYGKSGLDYAKTIRDAQTAKLNQMKTTVDLMKNTATSIMANPASARDQVVNFGRLTGTDVTGDLAQLDAIGGDLEKIKQWAAGHAVSADKLLPHFETENLGGTVERTAYDPITGQVVGKPTVQRKTMTPGEIAADRRARDRLTAESETGTYSPATIEYLASMYNQTRTLPALGIGKKAGEVKLAILDKARQLGTAAPTVASGEAPVAAPTVAEAAAKVVENKQTRAAEQSTVRAFSSGVEGRATRSFNTAIDHLDTMAELASALKNNNVKAFNAVGNAFATQTGSAAPTNFESAKSIVGGEVAKALTGSNMALADREEIRKSISSANSPEQLAGTIKTIQKLMGGQLQSLKQQYETGTGRKDFDSKLTGRSKEVVSGLASPEKSSAPRVTAMYARNPKTGERIMSLDGGNTWSPAR